MYRNSDWKLRKPVLVVDGFDPGNDRKDDTLFFNYLNNSRSIKFADLLYLSGYDLVILDLPKAFNQFANKVVDGGGDFIERNAMVVVKVIQEINSQLITNGSTEKLVVIGPSMGGLITRYALAYMEQNGLNHNTRLWVSFDSPHNGANIPIGVQHFVNYFASISDDAEASRDEKLNCIAAKQMLLHHYLSGSESPTGATGFRNNFVSSLNSIGFPQNLRRVSVLNGSLNGTNSYATCSRAATMSIKGKFIWGWTEIGWGYINTTPSNGNRCLIFKRTKPSPFSSTTSKYAISLPNSYSLDNSPGGTNNTFEQVSQNMVGFENLGDNIIVYKSEWSTPIKAHSFIPTKSALAFTGSNQDLAENLSERDLVATGETPFQSYWGPINKNMEHITFDQNLAFYLMNEINGVAMPTAIGEYIAAPSSVCPSATFSLLNIPSGVAITWDYSTNLVYLGGQGTPQLTVTTTNPSVGGMGWVEATLSGDYGSTKIRKDFWVGVPSQPLDIMGFSYNGKHFGSNSYYDLSVNASLNQGTNLYEWAVGGGTIEEGQGTNQITVLTCNAGDLDKYFDVSVRVGNACGWSPWLRRTGYVNGGVGPAYIVSPNPANSNITISKIENSKSNQTEPIRSIRIFDKMGLPIMVQNYSGKDYNVTINVSSLSKGVYLIKINEKESHTIIKE